MPARVRIRTSNKPATTPKLAADNPYHRSRVTNGNGLFIGDVVDSRQHWPRRLRDLLQNLLSDRPNASEATKLLARRAACLAVECELAEGKMALAGEASGPLLDRYIRTCGALRRTLQAIGLERDSKDVSQYEAVRMLLEGKSTTEIDAIEDRIRKLGARNTAKLTDIEPDMPIDDDAALYANELSTNVDDEEDDQ